MANYSKKSDVEAALQKARNRLAKAREKKDEKAFNKAMKECEDLRVVLDRWPK